MPNQNESSPQPLPDVAASKQYQPIDTLEDALSAATELIRAAQRNLYIYSPHVPTTLFGAEPFGDALRFQLTHATRLHCKLLLPSARHWRRSCPMLINLITQLSALELRVLTADQTEDKKEFNRLIIIADRRAFLLLHDPARYEGQFSLDSPSETRNFTDFFIPLWQHCQVDYELRQLGI